MAQAQRIDVKYVRQNHRIMENNRLQAVLGQKQTQIL
jgi:hypothetical protein